ncbi:glycosyltransferase [Kitasatospora sp. NPDC094011]|uniref:glycosyltransferase n=1 Tax=Kitasatospora sp. NPDC094011 TaxID=3364090 RepID=UPI003804B5C7
MRILLTTHRFAGDNAGGTEILANDVARALKARGLHVSWLAAGDPPPSHQRTADEYLSLPAVFTDEYPVRWRVQEAEQARRVEQLLATRSPVDLVHVLHFSRTGLKFLDAPSLHGVPVVATLTDYTAVCPDHQLVVRSTGTQCTATAASRDCLGCLEAPWEAVGDVAGWRARNVAWLNERVRALWTQTPYQATELAKAGVDLGKVVRDRACYGLPSAWAPLATGGPVGQYLLFLGRCSPEKGLHLLLDGFRASDTELPLLIATVPDDTAYEERMQSLAAADPRVRWLPRVSRTEVGPVLADARALLVPSQWWENHPLVAHEARALGVPVWSSAVPSMRHLADEPGLHLVQDYRDPAAWTRALDAASRHQAPRVPSLGHRIEEFELFADEIVSVYRKVVAA